MAMSMRTIALFMSSLLAVTWLFQAVAVRVTGGPGSQAIVPWMVVTMFVPTIWTVVYILAFNRKALKQIRFIPRRPLILLLSALLPSAIALGVVAIMVWQGWGETSFFVFHPDGAEVRDGPWRLGMGMQNWAYLAANIGLTAAYFACLNSVIVFGEEFGWRGLLQDQLIGHLGFFRGVTLLGFVWGIWHLPFNLAGYNCPHDPVLGALVLFPIELIAMSFIMACLTRAGRSFWPAVLLHGSVNGAAQGLVESLSVTGDISPTAPKLVQIALIVVVAILCVLLTPPHIRNPQAEPPPAV
jgi:membrane protease YdiL (CAAX protease family)